MCGVIYVVLVANVEKKEVLYKQPARKNDNWKIVYLWYWGNFLLAL